MAPSAGEAEASVGRRRSDRLIATHPSTRRASEAAAAAARSDLPVLIWGPPGSGRSFFARAVHAWSPRAQRPYVEVPCEATPHALQERELFGCEAGSDAQLPDAHTGALERADGGSVLLEGLAGLSAKAHDTLVQAATEQRFRRAGAPLEVKLQARLIATGSEARNRSPFGELPYHEIVLAPLSERREEILPLATHFLALCAREAGISPVGFTREARAALLEEPWHGNVTELQERIRHAVGLTRDGAISAEALLLAPDAEQVPSFRDAKRAFETRYVTTLLRRCGGNVSQAARLAKKDRKDFYDVIRRTGVRPADFR